MENTTHKKPHTITSRLRKAGRNIFCVAFITGLGLGVCISLSGCSDLPPNPILQVLGIDKPASSAPDTAPSPDTTVIDSVDTSSVPTEPVGDDINDVASQSQSSERELSPIQGIRTGAYYDNLPAELQDAYLVIGTAVESAQELVDIDIALDNDSLNAVLTALQNDRPDLFWFPGSASGMAQNGSTSIRLTYTATGEELAAQQAAFNDRVNEILAQVEGLTPADQEKAVHDLLISETSYIHDSQEKQGQSAYTALVEGQSVCAGYTRAFKHLMDELGIPCVYISGQALDSKNNANEVIASQTESPEQTPAEASEDIWSSHAWCIVSLDDTWYNVDITWDDNTLLNQETILYTHFNEEDSSFNQAHQRDDNAAFLPACTSAFDFEGTYGTSRIQAAADALGISIYTTVDSVESYQNALYTLAWDTPDFNCDFYLIITDDALLSDLQNYWQTPLQEVYEQRGFSGTISFNSTAQQLEPGENLAHIVITVN